MLVKLPGAKRIVFTLVVILHHDVGAFVFACCNQPVSAVEAVSHQRIAGFELVKYLPLQPRFTALFPCIGAKFQGNPKPGDH